MRKFIDELNKLDWSQEAPDWLSVPAIIFFILVLSQWLDVYQTLVG